MRLALKKVGGAATQPVCEMRMTLKVPEKAADRCRKLRADTDGVRKTANVKPGTKSIIHRASRYPCKRTRLKQCTELRVAHRLLDAVELIVMHRQAERYPATPTPDHVKTKLVPTPG